MANKRMNREQFSGVVSKFDEDRLRKALWNLYWRGTADVRARIELELAGDGVARPTRPAKPPVDPGEVRAEIEEFVALARAGAYLGRDRRVSPRERSRWRFTFKRLATEAQSALRAEEAAPAEAALGQLIDLASDARDYDYFRSQDPLAAAGFVVSDAVAVLWVSMWERHGFEVFAQTAAPQLIRWESEYGWTRIGDGPVVAQETTLAAVLGRMLRIPDTWEHFAEQYVSALDALGEGSSHRPRGSDAAQRAGDLAEWHGLLLDNLVDVEGGPLDKIAGHDALGGPERTFFAARLAHRRGDNAAARTLVARCLQKLPGHPQFRELATVLEV